MPDRTREEWQQRFQEAPDEELIRLLVHDLRGPLTGLISATRLLSTEQTNAEQIRELGQILHRAAHNMELILEAVLEQDRSRRSHLPDDHA
ncbi:MAG: hypothetical protein K8J31_09800 [Anaerolineae bacterium]|nr:hypothetical protein [Anaerolineae bacterium]